MSFAIITDVTCDLTAEQLSKINVACLPMAATIGSLSYTHYPDGRELSSEQFYARVRAGEATSTSAINIGDWSAAIMDELEANDEVLVLAFSSGLSCTYSNAVLAAELVHETRDCKVIVIDTLAASGGEGLIVLEAARLRDEGKSFEETAAAIRELVPKTGHWFTVNDLHHLHRGGRVSAASAIVGSALGIKPVLHVDDEGHLINMSTVRGRKKSIDALLDQMAKTLDDPDGPVLICHADCYEDAAHLAELIKAELGVKDVIINTISPIIGAHTGVGAVALFFIAKHK